MTLPKKTVWLPFWFDYGYPFDNATFHGRKEMDSRFSD